MDGVDRTVPWLVGTAPTLPVDRILALLVAWVSSIDVPILLVDIAAKEDVLVLTLVGIRKGLPTSGKTVPSYEQAASPIKGDDW